MVYLSYLSMHLSISARLLSPETIRDLESLANSKISDMDFSRFTNLLEDQITKVRV